MTTIHQTCPECGFEEAQALRDKVHAECLACGSLQKIQMTKSEIAFCLSGTWKEGLANAIASLPVLPGVLWCDARGEIYHDNILGTAANHLGPPDERGYSLLDCPGPHWAIAKTVEHDR